jgi:hypothetical protein
MRDRMEIRLRPRCLLRLLSMFCDLRVFEHGESSGESGDTNVCASLWNRTSGEGLSKVFTPASAKAKALLHNRQYT